MNICHVITRLIIGGAQENTLLTCRGLVTRGHQVTLIAGPETGPEGSLWDDAGETGCDLITEESLSRAVGPLRDPAAFYALRRHFKRIRPDVVHTHSSKAGILGRAAAASARVPIIVHTIHGMSFNRTQSAPVRWLYKRLERRAGRRTTAFVTVADAMIDQAVEAGLGPREAFTTIRSGMVVGRFTANAKDCEAIRRQWGVTGEQVVVGTVARLFENKGYEEIIESMPAAVEGCDTLKFVWIGDGAHREVYQRRLEEMGLRDRVRFVGLVHPDEVAVHLCGFDIVLHASRWEGLPRALAQGSLAGLPTISFDNDGAPEVVIPNETGILVPYGDTVALARAIVTLANDADLRHRLGRQGRLFCGEMFNWHKMVDELEALYHHLAENIESPDRPSPTILSEHDARGDSIA